MSMRAKSRNLPAVISAAALLLATACGADDDDDAQSNAGSRANGRDSGSDEAGSQSSGGSMGNDASADSGRGSNVGGRGDQAGTSASEGGTGSSEGGSDGRAGEGGEGGGGGNDAGEDGGGDSGSGDAGSGDAGDGGSGEPIDEDAVPMFVAQGDVGRLVVSCDDGVSWARDTSDDDALRCFASNNMPDCNHSTNAGRGIAFGSGHFVAGFGWGDPPGGAVRSADGESWTEVVPDRVCHGIAYGNGVFLCGGRTAKRSTNGGETWTDTPQTINGYNVRRTAFVEHDGGRFISVGDNGDIALSRDDGASFYKPTTIPTGCGANIQWAGGIAANGAGRMLIVGGDGVACYSDDDGDTWMMSSVGGALSGHLIWTGSEFLTYGSGRVYRSANGETWTSQNLSPGLALGAVARSADSGTFVAVSGGFQQWYDDQVFYRSSDGLSWSAIDGAGYDGGHPIRHIVFGWGMAGGACPAQ